MLRNRVQRAGFTDRGDSYLSITGNTANLDAGNLGDLGFRGQIMDVARQMGFQIQESGPGGVVVSGGSWGEMGGGKVEALEVAVPVGAWDSPAEWAEVGRGANFKQPLIEGSATETYSNSALNARNYSLTGQTLEKPVQIGNNFSFTLGGAIPFLKTKSSSQGRSSGRGPVSQPGWSFTYSGSRNRSAQDVLTTVPTRIPNAPEIFRQTYVQTLMVDPQTGRTPKGLNWFSSIGIRTTHCHALQRLMPSIQLRQVCLNSYREQTCLAPLMLPV